MDPNNIEKLEYIEATGTQYIDTRVIPTNHQTEIKFDMGEYSIENLFGTESGNMYYFFMTYNNQWHFRW